MDLVSHAHPSCGRSVADAIELGKQVLPRDDVMEGVPELVNPVQIDAPFGTATQLVPVSNIVIPGEWLLCDEPIEINRGRRILRVTDRNAEFNRALDFDRPATIGMRLDAPSGQSIRFAPGDEREMDLVEFGGSGQVIGFNNLLNGSTSAQ